MEEYNETIQFWNQIFHEKMTFNPNDPIKIKVIEEALQFMGKNCSSIIDYGCGHGKMLLRCLMLGTNDVCAMDISQNAIKVVEKVASTYQLQNRVTSKTGGIEVLKEEDNKSCSGAILFNILDNMTIKDGTSLIHEIHRIIDDNGYVLLKLNPYLTKVECEENQLKEITSDFYVDSEGLYLWNISDELLKTLLDNLFVIEKVVKVNHGVMTERLYYLKKIN
ncbi:class I SAM-dependent methyltransferase [Mycoplasmatota bacterium]|nr:class I SAM-dependent methyltransferase [Mycoplasmatota bacterium]